MPAPSQSETPVQHADGRRLDPRQSPDAANKGNVRQRQHLPVPVSKCGHGHKRCDVLDPMRPVSELNQQESQTSAPRLLIVEDEIWTVFAMREFFSFNGYRVD